MSNAIENNIKITFSTSELSPDTKATLIYSHSKDVLVSSDETLFDENLFEVRGAFPAITREDLSETVLKSIEDLQYTVNLEGLEMYKVPDENFPEILSDLTKVEDSA